MRHLDASEVVSNKFPVTELLITGKSVRAIVDTADLPLVLGFSTRWHARFDRTSKTHYALAGHAKTLLHRVITSAPDGMTVDHWDHDGLNNRRANLRVVTQAVNSANTRREIGVSGFSNVVPRENGKFRASVMVNGKRRLLGDWPTAELAADAVKRFRGKGL